jgi:hypothetical protein
MTANVSRICLERIANPPLNSPKHVCHNRCHLCFFFLTNLYLYLSVFQIISIFNFFYYTKILL